MSKAAPPRHLGLGRPIGALLIVVVGTVVGGGVARAERRLTADEVAARAAETSQLLRARGAEIEAAEAALAEARVAWWPRLGARGRYARLSPITPPTVGNIVVAAEPGPVPPDGLMAQPFSFPVVLDDLVMQASLTVPLSDYVLRVPHVTRVAEQQRDAARAARAASTLQVGADGRLLFYGWARAQLQRAVAAQALEQASAHLRDVDAAVAAQTATAADRLRVESQRASAELLVLRATHLVALLADQLRTALHDTGGEPYVLGEDLDAEPDPTPAGLASIEQAFGDALVRRPELVQAAAAEGAEAAQRRAVRSGGWPRLEAFGEILAGSPHPRFFPPSSVFRTTWAVGVQMAWSPNELLSSAAASRAGAAREEARRAQRALVAEQIRIEVVRAFQAWRESEAARRTAVRGLAAAEEAYRVRREQFRAGRATSVELIDAETNLTRARLEAVDARVDARIARVQLLRATGRG